MLKAIETSFDGYRFRSRTEARWAVFFKTAGIRFDYEPQGFVIEGVPYLPDFWLPDGDLWLEIKGAEPTEVEQALCVGLAKASGKTVLLAEGPPQAQPQILKIYATGDLEDDAGRLYWADDRRDTGVFWLVDGEGFATLTIGRKIASDHDKFPLVHSATKQGYEAAKAARFEHGEKP